MQLSYLRFPRFWILILKTVLFCGQVVAWGFVYVLIRALPKNPDFGLLFSVAAMATVLTMAHAALYIRDTVKTKHRARELAQVADRMRLIMRDHPTLPRPDFRAFLTGDGGYDLFVMEGELGGRPIRTGDYQFVLILVSTDVKDLATSYDFSYCFLVCGQAQFPRLLVRPETGMDKTLALAGLDDIDFESSEFSNRYYVQSDDRKFAYEVLTPGFIQLFMDHPEYSVYLDERGIVVFKGEYTWQSEEFEPAARFCAAVARAIPDFLWVKYAGKSAGPERIHRAY